MDAAAITAVGINGSRAGSSSRLDDAGTQTQWRGRTAMPVGTRADHRRMGPGRSYLVENTRDALMRPWPIDTSGSNRSAVLFTLKTTVRPLMK